MNLLQDTLRHKIDELIEKLDSDDIEIRTNAERALIDLGVIIGAIFALLGFGASAYESFITYIRDKTAAYSSPEVKSRGKHIVDTLTGKAALQHELWDIERSLWGGPPVLAPRWLHGPHGIPILSPPWAEYYYLTEKYNELKERIDEIDRRLRSRTRK